MWVKGPKIGQNGQVYAFWTYSVHLHFIKVRNQSEFLVVIIYGDLQEYMNLLGYFIGCTKGFEYGRGGLKVD